MQEEEPGLAVFESVTWSLVSTWPLLLPPCCLRGTVPAFIDALWATKLSLGAGRILGHADPPTDTLHPARNLLLAFRRSVVSQL